MKRGATLQCEPALRYFMENSQEWIYRYCLECMIRADVIVMLVSLREVTDDGDC